MSGWGSRDPEKIQTGLGFNPDWALCPLGDLSKGHHFPRPLWQHLLKGRGIMPTSGATGIGKDPSKVLCVGLSLGLSTRESPRGGEWAGMPSYPSCCCLSTFFPMFILSK